jgi:hypothetical protein
MFNALLLALVHFAQTIVYYLLGTVLILAGIVAVVTAVQWLRPDAAHHESMNGRLTLSRERGGSVALAFLVAAVYVVGALALWMR